MLRACNASPSLRTTFAFQTPSRDRRAVIVHPEDFAWLEAIVDAYRARARPLELELTADDLEAHAATDRDDQPWDELNDPLDAEAAAV